MKLLLFEILAIVWFAILAIPSVSVYERPPAVVAIVTAYNSLPDQTDEDPFIMASGNRVYDGAVACPHSFRFGTKVLIKERVYICEDRMNRKFSNRFDVWMLQKADAVQFGKQQLTVMILQ